MINRKLYGISFSPTGTSKQNMQSVASRMKHESFVEWDYTYDVPTASEQLIPDNATAIFSVPVYGGLVAPLALKRLESIRGTNTPTVLMVNYGNRDFEGALLQLDAFVRERGFIPIAAGAFVGEHSYSTVDTPIAQNRPDAEDAELAELFGEQIAEKLARLSHTDVKQLSINISCMPRLKTPFWSKLRFIWFVLGYRRRQKKHPVKLLPMVNTDLCTHCGKCVVSCPNQAIIPGDEHTTDSKRCIRCCACVKNCPVSARTFHSPFAPVLSKCFDKRRNPVVIC